MVVVVQQTLYLVVGAVGVVVEKMLYQVVVVEVHHTLYMAVVEKML